jgi:hypothetical protein
MALDAALSEAIRTATRNARQGDAVAKRLLAWLTRLSEDELSREANAQFYDELRQSLTLEDGHAD